jgi:general secretion pathway protein L
MPSETGIVTALAIILPGWAAAETHWVRISRGNVVARGKGLHWPREGVDRFVLIAPATTVVLHRLQLPGLDRKRAEAAAREFALDHSAGAPESLHIAVGNRDSRGNIDVAVIDAAGLGDWISWAQAENFDPDAIVPAALLLPLPAEGAVVGWIGDEHVARDPSSGFPAEHMTQLEAEAPVSHADTATIDAAMVAAVVRPPLDLRQGRFAKRRPRTGPRLMRFYLVLAGIAVFAGLLLVLLDITKHH